MKPNACRTSLDNLPSSLRKDYATMASRFPAYLQNMPCVLARVGDCGSKSSSFFSIAASQELSSLIIVINISL
ncbi:hypothetical protein GQX74_008889 [Glossina fuscipes]|nr:hypothetical protein GQX74_008889 [Glossina fuscipes]